MWRNVAEKDENGGCPWPNIRVDGLGNRKIQVQIPHFAQVHSSAVFTANRPTVTDLWLAGQNKVIPTGSLVEEGPKEKFGSTIMEMLKTIAFCTRTTQRTDGVRDRILRLYGDLNFFSKWITLQNAIKFRCQTTRFVHHCRRKRPPWTGSLPILRTKPICPEWPRCPDNGPRIRPCWKCFFLIFWIIF